jgi:hypothetical protein
MNMKKLLTTIILLFFSVAANADYQVTGAMSGHYCTGFVIKSCAAQDIVYISRDEQLYEPGQVYDDNLVSYAGEYRGRRARCTLYPYGNPLGGAIRDMRKRLSNVSYFYRNDSGELIKFKPDSIQFSCRKV